MSNENQFEDEDVILQYTQEKRKALVESVSKEGPPVDKDDRITMLAALADMDRAALGKARIKVDKKLGNAQEQAAAIMAQVLSQTLNNNPYRSSKPVDRELPELSADIPVPEVVPGELDIKPCTLNIDDFVLKQKT